MQSSRLLCPILYAAVAAPGLDSANVLAGDILSWHSVSLLIGAVRLNGQSRHGQEVHAEGQRSNPLLRPMRAR